MYGKALWFCGFSFVSLYTVRTEKHSHSVLSLVTPAPLWNAACSISVVSEYHGPFLSKVCCSVSLGLVLFFPLWREVDGQDLYCKYTKVDKKHKLSFTEAGKRLFLQRQVWIYKASTGKCQDCWQATNLGIPPMPAPCCPAEPQRGCLPSGTRWTLGSGEIKKVESLFLETKLAGGAVHGRCSRAFLLLLCTCAPPWPWASHGSCTFVPLLLSMSWP